MGKWLKTIVSPEQYEYVLKREVEPKYFATVYMVNGKWTYRFGTRLKDGEEQKFWHTHKRWASPAAAKAKVLHQIFWKSTFDYPE